MCAGSGSCHASSPVSAAAARYSATASSSPMTPAWRVPRAMVIAPVSVATSTITSGCSRLAATRPSARTSRPSASVLSTSTVVPSRIRTTSPGRVARPDGMLSAMQSHAVTLTGAPIVGHGAQHRERGRGAAHVVFHADHGGRGFERQPARVEGDPLADQRHMTCRVRRARIRAARDAAAGPIPGRHRRCRRSRRREARPRPGSRR